MWLRNNKYPIKHLPITKEYFLTLMKELCSFSRFDLQKILMLFLE